MLKPYFELHFASPGRAMKLEEFEELLGFQPEVIYKSQENIYGISAIYTIDDDVTKGIIAHEFAELLALEQGIEDHEAIDQIAVDRGYGWELLFALQNILPGRVERGFINREDLERRVNSLREKIGQGSKLE